MGTRRGPRAAVVSADDETGGTPMEIISPAHRAEPRQDTGRALRALALAAVAIGLLVLTGAACVLSYPSVHALASQAGVSASLARIYPVAFDALLVISGCCVLALRGAGLPSRLFGWLCLLALLAGLTAAGAAHAAGVALPRRPAQISAATIPWVLVLIGFGLMLTLLRHARRGRAARRPAQPVPPQPVPPQPVPPQPVPPQPWPAQSAEAQTGQPSPAARPAGTWQGPEPGSGPVTAAPAQPAPVPAAPVPAERGAAGPADDPPVAGTPAVQERTRPAVQQAELQLRARIRRQQPGTEDEASGTARDPGAPLMPPAGPVPPIEDTKIMSDARPAGPPPAGREATIETRPIPRTPAADDPGANPGPGAQRGDLSAAPTAGDNHAGTTQATPPELRRARSTPTPPGDEPGGR